MYIYASTRVRHHVAGRSQKVSCASVDNDSTPRSYFTRLSSIIHAVNNAALFCVTLYSSRQARARPCPTPSRLSTRIAFLLAARSIPLLVLFQPLGKAPFLTPRKDFFFLLFSLFFFPRGSGR